jgi:cell division protein FtsQ
MKGHTNFKRRFNWKKFLLIACDIVLGAYIVVAFAAFNKPQPSKAVCEKVAINIEDESTNGFLSAQQIKSRLVAEHLYPANKRLSLINTRDIEDALKQSPFVKTAQCYKTQDGEVNISLTQRMPTLHIKVANDDYYLDDNHNIMRPRAYFTSDLIVATGNISQWYARNYVSYLADALMASDFWRNQIEQINVLPDHGVELVPRVGNHIIYIGKLPETKYIADREKLVTDYVNKKMTRLRKFYQYGLSKVGWNKYSYINLEFDNQIICKKRKLN